MSREPPSHRFRLGQRWRWRHAKPVTVEGKQRTRRLQSAPGLEGAIAIRQRGSGAGAYEVRGESDASREKGMKG